MAYAVATMVEIVGDYHKLKQDDYSILVGVLLSKARSVRDVLLNELNSPLIPDDLEIRLIDAVHMAEDLIELAYVHDRLGENSTGEEEFDDRIRLLFQHFEDITNKICYMDYVGAQQPTLPLDHLSSEQVPWYPKLHPRTKDDVSFIFQDDFKTLKERLIQGPSKLQIITIDGSFGMGKRTLARRLYNDPEIATHFRTRAWVSSSPYDINERNNLLGILEGLGILTKEMKLDDDEDKLRVRIKNALKRVKYFFVIPEVVLEDNWVIFTSLFRDYGVGARVLVTTSTIDEAILSKTAHAKRYEMRLLTDIESWLLLRHKVFGREYCPDELEPIGKAIMQLCAGNPQVVSLAAGILATSDKTPEVWDLVGTALSNSGNISGVTADFLNLIYRHLPHYLRPCLLYTGAFCESRDIKASQIIKLWIAEGFVQQRAGECLEDVADTYLKILIDKNLLCLTHEEPNGRVKAFQTQLYLRLNYWFMANHEKFLGSESLDDVTRDEMDKARENNSVRRISARGVFITSEEELSFSTRSVLSVSSASRHVVSMYLKLRLLRVLELFQLEFYQFPMEIVANILLRYLALSCHSILPKSIATLVNLQTLIIRRVSPFRAFSLPSDLWGLKELRHVKCKESFVLLVPNYRQRFVHENLQTLSNMQLLTVFGVPNKFLGMIPNIRNLGIVCNFAMTTFFDLARLDKLEKLKCSSDWSLASRNFLSFLTLPRSLRKLTLTLCRIPSEFMKLVGLLPNLELLKLQKSDFVGVNSVRAEPKWETAAGEFPKLLSLEMLDLNLVHWRADAANFPRLKHLAIKNCYAMVEVPLDIGNIQSLELIQVDETSPSALVSAMEIRKEQQGRGNKVLQVRIHKVV